MPITYILSPADDKGRAAVRSFASEDAARAAATKNDYVLRTPNDIFLQFPRNIMCEFYNAVTGSHLKKFETREAGTARLWAALEQHAFAAEPTETSTQPRHKQPTPTVETLDPVVLYDKVAAAEGKPDVTTAAKVDKSKPGVIGAIIEILQAGGGTVDEIYAQLRERFPDRGEGMLTTTKIQVKRLAKEGKLAVKSVTVEGRGTVFSA